MGEWKGRCRWFPKKPVEPKGSPMEQQAFIEFWCKNAGLTWEDAQAQGYKITQCKDCKSSTCKGWHISK